MIVQNNLNQTIGEQFKLIKFSPVSASI